MFVIKNNNRYIGKDHSGNIVVCRNKTGAIFFESKKEASEQISKLPKPFRKLGFFVEEIEKPEEVKQEVQSEELNEEVFDLSELFGKIQDITDLISFFLSQEDAVAKEYDKVCAMEEDIRHAIEFNVEDVLGGYRLYKAMHDIRVRRRECKNVLRVIGAIKNGDLNFANVMRELKNIDGMRYYLRNKESEQFFKDKDTIG